jgi:HAD superfamily hydrolase (TIGR01509 family)
MPCDLVLFDFDGTLVDSQACITAALEGALASRQRACHTARLHGLIGLPIDAIVRGVSPGIGDEDIPDVVVEYRKRYAALEAEMVRPFPDAITAIDDLRSRGIRLAIATNKRVDAARLTLARHRIVHHFDAIVGAEHVRHPKPHPEALLRALHLTRTDPADTLVVGDTIWDIEMAHSGGAASCAVTWGMHDARQLREARPSYSVNAFPALLTVVSQWSTRRG